jgi:3-oxoacyl-[acyl-carrier protein] reductase
MKPSGIRAIVTGAASGIGLATAKALVEAGASRVGMLARDRQKLDAAIEGLGPSAADRVVPLLADVRRPDELSAAFGAFVKEAGGLDVLVNNAGVLLDGALVSFSFKGLVRYSLENWQTTVDTNLTGAFLCSQLAAELMFRARSKGVIVNISSISRRGLAGQAAYSASKGGIASITFTMAQELAAWGIRCVAIAPGLVETPMVEKIPEEYRRQMLERVAAHRMGRPEEIAHGVLFCVENDYFNGRVLELDGGTFG